MAFYLKGETRNLTPEQARDWAHRNRPAFMRLTEDRRYNVYLVDTKPVQPGQKEFKMVMTDEFLA